MTERAPWKSALTFIGFTIGPFLVVMGAVTWRGATAAQRWERVDGVITHSTVEMAAGSDDHSLNAYIRYAYDYRGRHYEGRRIRYGLVTTNRSTVALVSHYPPRTPVDVFVDPSKPDRSVLKQGGAGTGIWELVIGTILFAFYLQQAAADLRARKRTRADARG